ncbi:uncharacterized protein BCR38DRAFT_490324 [Pseudomassariella vexata]|uniref:Uncharacterized protein n=1 Tax=Pseudomassariella vexata TaxID=1141098 RepID=A0A1Y2DC90_9PEZI|nr:uncharacterized protein BCR38DRAFT_490324 [Pseudomassariella vexata]ORY56879.1 hypothetical protein BCR38DRAFT_490324 [Pseudomassariella vexata]
MTSAISYRWVKSHSTRKKFWQCVTPGTMLVRKADGYPVKHESLRSMEELRTANTMPFYLDFAAQILLDVNYTLQKHNAVVFDTFVRHGNILGKQLDENLESELWPAVNDGQSRAVQSEFNRIL